MPISFIRFPKNKTTTLVIPDAKPQDIDTRAGEFLAELENKVSKFKKKRKDACSHFDSILQIIIKNIPRGEERAMKRPDIMRAVGLHIYDKNNWLAWILFQHIKDMSEIGITHRNGREAYYIKDSSEN